MEQAAGNSVNSVIDREQHASVQWPVSFEYEQCLLALREGVRQAQHWQTPLLVSFTQSVPLCDPLRLFTAHADRGQGSFFWEQPSERKALVGLGEVALIEAQGAGRFSDVARHWEEILHHAVVRRVRQNRQEPTFLSPVSGPLLFGGFAFDDYGADSRLWQGFFNSLLILPSLMFSLHADQATLTLNHFVRPTDDAEALAEAIDREIAWLQTRVEHHAQNRIASAQRVLFEQTDPQALSASAWKGVVEQATKTIGEDTFQKVVLARTLKTELTTTSEDFASDEILQRLRHSYPEAFVFAFQRGERTFIGATPERLAAVHGKTIETMALAGSARRGVTPEDDHQIGTTLLNSRKDLEEHGLVVAMIRKCLQTFCEQVVTAPQPQLLKLKNVQHLMTRIVGKLCAGQSILDLLTELHPTPAVGGLPNKAALAFIHAHEQLDRGWYAGPIGWVDAKGNGEFAVALRCGVLDKREAVLFAGCGIVADSDPEREYEESCIKLRAMIQGLCGAETLA